MKFSTIFKRQIQVARVAGIPVRIDYRWFLVFALSAWVIAASFEQGTTTVRRVQLESSRAWVAGVITTLGLFLSILFHELSHALVGRAEGIESDEIVLHPFGGFTRLSREPDNPRAEFRIAVAGPASSFLIGVISFALMSVATLLHLWTVGAAFFIIGFWNFLLAVSNLLPGYPLDGGRVLRAFLWHRHGSMEEATRVASLGGQLIAGALVVFGGYFYFRVGDPFMGLWLVLVGVFLFDAARSVVRGRGGRGRLRTVAEAMRPPVPVEPETLVSHFIDLVLPMHRQEVFAVAREGSLHGLLTLEDLQKLPAARRPRTRIAEVMRPVDKQFFVQTWTPLADAEKLMKRNGIGALAVIDEAGRLVGFLPRGMKIKRGAKA